MKKLLFLSVLVTILASSCKKDNDSSPNSQDIVNNDTSPYTGILKVKVYYNDGSVHETSEGVWVKLYATTQDIPFGYSMFELATNNSGVAYFGYINMGNYYVVCNKNIGGVEYQGVDMVQVRPRREEVLQMTMFPK